MRLLLAGIAVAACSSCDTLEHVVEQHPIATTVVVAAGAAALTGYLVQKRARHEFEDEARQLEAGLQ